MKEHKNERRWNPSHATVSDLVVVALQLLMKTLVALLHLLLVTDQCCQAVQGTGVQIVGMAPHNSTQRLRLTNHLRPRLGHTDPLKWSSLNSSKRRGERLSEWWWWWWCWCAGRPRTGQRPANQLAMSTQESAYLAHSADIISCFLFLSLLSHAEQQSSVLFIALHSQSHEALHCLQQLEGDKHKTRLHGARTETFQCCWPFVYTSTQRRVTESKCFWKLSFCM